MREAPSRIIIRELISRGAQIVAHDPVATQEAWHAFESDFKDQSALLSKIKTVDKPNDALEGADALIIVTEWKAFRSPDFELLKQKLKNPIIFDGRNLFEPENLSELGFIYHGIGRHN